MQATATRRAGHAPLPVARPHAARMALVTAAALALGLLAGCSSAPAATTGPSAPRGAVIVNTSECGRGVGAPRPGWHTFTLYNASTEAAEVDLIDPVNGAVYAEVEALGPATTSPMRVDLGSGAYAFRCLLEDTDPLTGPTIRVGGHVRGATAILPVTTDDLLSAAREYHAYVTAGLDTLVLQVALLDKKVSDGNLAGARAAWLPAHLTYESLGAAYGTFGDFDTEIDGRADGLVGGVASPQFTGFYRLEYGLWHGQNASELARPAARLDRDVRALRQAWPAMEQDLLDIGLRTHEILENALEFQLSGHDDYGSGTTLATTAANITGTQELLSILHPLLSVRYQGLPSVYFWLSRLRHLITAEQQPNGTWTPAHELPTLTRQRIDAAAGQALQELAPIASITEPRRN